MNERITITTSVVSITLLFVWSYVATYMSYLYDQEVVIAGVSSQWFATIMLATLFVLAPGVMTWYTHVVWRALHNRQSLGESMFRKVETAILNAKRVK